MSIELVDTKQYYLSSSSTRAIKHNGEYNSKLTFEIPNFISNKQNTIYHTISVLNANIPYSFYIINEYNNKFKFNNETIELDLGNYNAITLANLINQEIHNVDGSCNIVLDQVTGKYKISSPNTFTLNLTVSDLAEILGTDKGVYNAIFNFIEGFHIDFPYLVNTSGSKYINVRINNLITENLNMDTGDKQTLVNIPINVSPFGIIRYDNNTRLESLVKNDDMNLVELELTDDKNRLINFNNINWGIVILIKTKKTFTKVKSGFNDYFRQIENTENLDELNQEE